jgi:hypothetical protein
MIDPVDRRIGDRAVPCQVLLGRFHSIPAFLSQVTTDLWNAQTSYTTFM